MTESRRIFTPNAFATLRRQYRIVVLAMAVSLAVALALSSSMRATYTATASLALKLPTDDFPLLGASGTVRPPFDRANLEAKNLLSLQVLGSATAMLIPRPTIAQLKAQVTVSVQNLTNLIDITATASSAKRAASIANSVSTAARYHEARRERLQFANLANELESRRYTLPISPLASADARRQIGAVRALASIGAPLKIAGGAVPPAKPTSLGAARTGVIAGSVGLLIGIALVCLRSAFDPRLRGTEAIQSQLGLPLIGRLPAGAVLGSGPGSLSAAALEPFRIIQSNLTLLSTESGCKLVVVTSPLPERSKSAVASSLAITSALSGRRTLLVDCDLRHPELASYLALSPGAGLTDVLTDDTELGDAMRSMSLSDASRGGDLASIEDDLRLDCLPAGRLMNGAPELLGSDGFQRFLSRMRKSYELVMIAAPPLLPVIDTAELLEGSDVAVLCIPDGRTTRGECASVRAVLANVPDCIVGLVVTGISPGELERAARHVSKTAGAEPANKWLRERAV